MPPDTLAEPVTERLLAAGFRRETSPYSGVDFWRAPDGVLLTEREAVERLTHGEHA